MLAFKINITLYSFTRVPATGLGNTVLWQFSQMCKKKKNEENEKTYQTFENSYHWNG